ncbi:MAG: hypothetical protein K6E10_02940 [Eubacterium sp.]|nr:hypothetical protein [Eubacterium sp.]
MKLAAIFCENMILQRDRDVNVFGESDNKEHIIVEIDDIKVEKTVDAGKWCLKLAPHKAGGPYDFKASSFLVDESGNYASEKNNEIIIKNVLYGEVWLNNGQSNIEFELQNARGGEEELKNADFPEIRYYKAIKAPIVDDKLLEDEKHLKWTAFTDGKFREVSGIGYYYAVNLYKELGVPVGIVDCYQGGSSVTCWIEKDVLKEMPEGQFYLNEFEEATKGQTEEEFQEKLRDYNALVEAYNSRANAAKKENPNLNPEQLEAIAGAYPWPPPVGLQSAFRPGGLIETMFKRVAPFTIKGMVYYQGEEDSARNFNWMNDRSGDNTMYENLLRRMIQEYRKIYSEPDLPFMLVQLPMFISRNTEDIRDWAYIRAAQEKVGNTEDNVFMVPLTDLGDYDDVHPVDKKTPGKRVSDSIINYIYNDKKEPVYTYADGGIIQFTESGSKVTVRLSGSFDSIILKDNELRDLRNEGKNPEDDIFGLEVLVSEDSNIDYKSLYYKKEKPENSKWLIPEKAYFKKISDGNSEYMALVIEDKRPIFGVSYGFFNYAKVNVYNNNDMPLVQFRTCDLQVMEILKMAPVFKELIWGGSRLKTEYGYDIPSDKTGECWAVSGHSNGEGHLADGTFEGIKLSDLWKNHRELFGNMEGEVFPLLTKIIDANDDLSIQVHPDDEYAGVNENGSLGKMECWYILDCDPDAKIIIGHNAKTKEELESMIKEERWSDLLREVPISKGDFFQINPGTIHAIKAGTLILETQQSSDVTYRLYDYGRLQNGKPRPLHIDKSLDVIKVPFVPALVQNTSENTSDTSSLKVLDNKWLEMLYSCKYYTVWKAKMDGEEYLYQDRPFLIGSLLEGEVYISGDFVEERHFVKGDHFIIPFGAGKLKVRGKGEFIFSAPSF